MKQYTKFHFVCTSKISARLLMECGVRHTLVSYAFADRVLDKSWKRGGTFSWMRDSFDTIFVDSGAHTAFTQGREVDFDEYSQFLRNQREYIDVAAQLDIIGNQALTTRNYIRHVETGTEWVIPILTGHWKSALVRLEKHLVTKYLGLGGSKWWANKGSDGWGHARSMPSRYKYHGFAKGNERAFYGGWLYSIDSSSWTFGARGRVTAARLRKSNVPIMLGNKSKHDRQNLRRVYEALKDDFEACNTKYEDVVAGTHRDLLKLAVVTYYRPLFREISPAMFKENFSF